MTTGFWTENLTAASKDPKRNFRFRVSFTGGSKMTVDSNGASSADGVWYAKKVTQPKVTITESKHDFMMHKFYWPAKAEWNEIDLTLVDPVTPHVSRNLLLAAQNAGFKIPGSVQSGFNSMSKSAAVLQMGTLLLEHLDADGSAISSWSLKHAWAREIGFSDFDYGNEDLMEVTMKIRYDWAEFNTNQPNALKIFGV